MKALVFEAPEKAVVAEVPMPEPQDHEVLIRTAAIGICHSDYELLAGRYIIPITYPVRPGHEWCGEVVDVGKSVKGYKVGDRVIGECVFRTPDRVHHFGFSTNGADSEYFTVAPSLLHTLPDSISDKAATLIEPFTCDFYAILNAGGTNASQTVVVSGEGQSAWLRPPPPSAWALASSSSIRLHHAVMPRKRSAPPMRSIQRRMASSSGSKI
jgi:L-iditol 2-dehydrogenase